MSNKKKKREPLEVPINPMTYKRLLSVLRNKLVVIDQNFEPGLQGLMKGLYFRDSWAFHHEGKLAKGAAFISAGLGFSFYMHPVKGKVVLDMFSPGEIALNPDSFFNDALADSGLEFIADSNIMFVTAEGMDVLFKDFKQSKLLTIRTLAGMFGHIRAKDELYRLQGRARVQRFFELYPMLLRPARNAPMQHKDIASYLGLDPFHFSSLMKELYPDLND